MILAFLAIGLSAQSTPARDTTKHVPATPAQVASAYGDSRARELVARARRTRLQQDSALTSYDSKVRQRLSVLASIGRIGPEKLIYRHESAARVQWERGTGAHIEIT